MMNAARGYLLALSVIAMVGGGTAPALAVEERDTWLFPERVSVASDGTEANGDSNDPVLNYDGSIVVFTSSASNLVPGDTNDVRDIFLHDRKSGETERVSVASDGSQALGESLIEDLSSDGRFLLFSSDAGNLVAGDTNGVRDVFRRDLFTGETIRVSLANDGSELNAGSGDASMAADGNLVAFVSAATNVVAPVYDLAEDLYLRDIAAATTRRVDPQVPGVTGIGDPHHRDGIISADGVWAVVDRAFVVDHGFVDSAIHVLDLTTGEEIADLSGLCVADPIISDDSSVLACNVKYWYDYYRTDYFELPSVSAIRLPGPEYPTLLEPENYAYSISADGNVVGLRLSWYPQQRTVAAVYDRSRRTVTSVTGTGLIATAQRGFGSAVSGDGSVAAYGTDAPYVVSSDNNGRSDVFVVTWSEVTIGDAFADDADSIFQREINWAAAAGLFRGCNPPANDAVCPGQPMTRGQAAALFVRALNLSDDGGGDLFSDDDGSVFEGDIDKLAAAGISKGCNPPVNNRFCPNDELTRGEFAAFMARANDLTAGRHSGRGRDYFIDDDESIFEADIEKLAAAGITAGCNPPANDRFCPEDMVTRGQVAAFFARAFKKPGVPDSYVP